MFRSRLYPTRCAFVLALLIAAPAPQSLFAADAPDAFPPQPQVPYLTPEQTLRQLQVPPGYRLEPVLSAGPTAGEQV